MANLLDNIKSSLSSQEKPTVAAGEQGQTGLRDLLRAKTGQQVTGDSGPKRSSLAEKLAQSQTAQAGQQIATQGQLQAEGIAQGQADIAQRTQQLDTQFKEQLLGQEQDTRNKTIEMLDSFASGQRKIDSMQDIAALEQAGFQIRLSNEQYVNQLQKAAQTQRLDDMQEFKRAAARDAMKEYDTILRDDIKFRRYMDADDREFTEEIAQMELEDAIDLANDTMKAENARGIAEGVGGAVKGGAKMYGAYKDQEDK